MYTYLFLLLTIILAATTVGFAFAMLLLKLRWKLVGGTLLFLLGWVPLVIYGFGAGIFFFSGQVFSILFTTFGLMDLGEETLPAALLIGYLLGVPAGTLTGLWPRLRDEKWERNARRWPVVKTIAPVPVALVGVLALFWILDTRATYGLRTLQAELADRAANSGDGVYPIGPADKVCRRVLGELLDDPAWSGRSESEVTMPLKDVDLLALVAPNSPQVDDARAFCLRHAEAHRLLQEAIAATGQESTLGFHQLAHFAALQAVVHLLDGNLEDVADDLRLLRQMETRTLADPQGDFVAAKHINEYRNLVFQTVLLVSQEVPEAIFHEMQADVGDIRQAILRYLRRYTLQESINRINEWLRLPGPGNREWQAHYEAAVMRIVMHEELAASLERFDREVEQFFTSSSTRYDHYGASPFWGVSQEDYWFMISSSSGYTYPATNYAANHAISQELVPAVRLVTQFRSEHDALPTEQQFTQRWADESWTAGFPLRYRLVKDPFTGEILGGVVYYLGHSHINDQMGFYVGEPLIHRLNDTNVVGQRPP